MKLTREMIFAAQTSGRAWNRHQLELIGVTWPPIKGWLERSIGRDISEDDYARFKHLGGIRKKKERNQFVAASKTQELL